MRQFENCDTCQQDYDITPENAKLVCFLEDSRANHILATCTSCGAVETIFVTTDGFMNILQEHLPLRIAANAPDELLELLAALEVTSDDGQESTSADSAVLYQSGTSYDLPEPPRDQLMELWDTMRHFGGECGPKCLFPECLA